MLQRGAPQTGKGDLREPSPLGGGFARTHAGVLVGKWLIYREAPEIDQVWRTVATATFHGNLGPSAKVSPAQSQRKRYVVCVYTHNYRDVADVLRVRAQLTKLGILDRSATSPTSTPT